MKTALKPGKLETRHQGASKRLEREPAQVTRDREGARREHELPGPLR